MSAAFRLFLILMLALTSQELAAARGQSRAVSELVICAGAAVGMPAPPPVPRSGMARAILSLPVTRITGRDAPQAQARDPPMVLG